MLFAMNPEWVELFRENPAEATILALVAMAGGAILLWMKKRKAKHDTEHEETPDDPRSAGRTETPPRQADR